MELGFGADAADEGDARDGETGGGGEEAGVGEERLEAEGRRAHGRAELYVCERREMAVNWDGVFVGKWMMGLVCVCGGWEAGRAFVAKLS